MSIRKLERHFEGLGIKNLKHSTISNLMQKLDKDVEAFNNSNLGGCERPYLFLDATYMTCKDEGSQAIVTAITINDNGKKEFIGEQVVDMSLMSPGFIFCRVLRREDLGVLSSAFLMPIRDLSALYENFYRCKVAALHRSPR